MTTIEGSERRFSVGRLRRLEDDERGEVEAAFDGYLETIPEVKRKHSVSYAVKDVVGRSGFGIGWRACRAYSLLIEGRSQALENDVILSMKQGNVPAAEPRGRRRPDPRLLRAPGPPDGRLAARAAGARRPVAGLDRAARGRPGRRPSSRPTRPTSTGPGHRPRRGASRCSRYLGQRDGEGPLRVGRGQRPDARRLPDRGGDHDRRRRPRGGVRGRSRAPSAARTATTRATTTGCSSTRSATADPGGAGGLRWGRTGRRPRSGCRRTATSGGGGSHAATGAAASCPGCSRRCCSRRRGGGALALMEREGGDLWAGPRGRPRPRAAASWCRRPSGWFARRHGSGRGLGVGVRVRRGRARARRGRWLPGARARAGDAERNGGWVGKRGNRR